MANLWRILAIAWLGGVASPVLMDEPASVEALRPASTLAAPVSSDSAPVSSDMDVDRQGDDSASGPPDTDRV